MFILKKTLGCCISNTSLLYHHHSKLTPFVREQNKLALGFNYITKQKEKNRH